MTAFDVRAATLADMPQILAIYNDIIATSTAVYSLEPTSLEERAAWFLARTQAGYPVLVASGSDGVAGFATFGEFRGAWPGYRYSVEHSVHVRAEQRGQGVGTRLMHELVRIARSMDKHVMIGGIDAANLGSLRMHERLGFERVACFREVGRKFDRWLDLVFMQRLLDAPGARRPD